MDNTKTQSSESLVDVLISEHEIEKICTSRASQNNSNARTCEEPERLRASDLLDLYYKQQGCSFDNEIDTA
jgi:hypothetical protein